MNVPPFSQLDRGDDNTSHTNEEIARIRWNMIVPDEVTFQGRTMTKDKFIHKTGSGPEQWVISQVIPPVTAADDCDRTGVTLFMHKAWNTDGSELTPVAVASK